MSKAAPMLGDRIVGAWIGGSVDSTGAVIATASLVSLNLLQCAAVIKMLQNLLIGPVALVVAGVYAGEFRARIIWDKFPKFVIGFIIVAIATTFLPNANTLAANSFIVSEWFSALSFVMIGFDIDFNEIPKYFADGKKILMFYIVGQTFDIGLTLIAAWLAFRQQ